MPLFKADRLAGGAGPSFIGAWNKDYFVGGSLDVRTSNDGKVWTTRATFNAYTPNNSFGMMGDPALLVHNGVIWVVGSFGITTTDWAATALEVAKSTDGDTFTYSCSPDFASLVTGGTHKQVWTNTWFVDSDGSTYFTIEVSKNSLASPYIVDGVYIVPVDFTTSPPTFGTPVQFAGTGFPTNWQNLCLIKIGSTYYNFYKNITAGDPNIGLIQVASSTSLATGYTSLKSGDWAGWGGPWEAPFLMQLGSKWRIYLDGAPQAPNTGMYYSDSVTSDPLGSWGTPVATSSDYTAPHKLQHGGVIVNPTGH